MARTRAVLQGALLLGFSGIARAFYLPGVAPIDYARVRRVCLSAAERHPARGSVKRAFRGIPRER